MMDYWSGNHEIRPIWIHLLPILKTENRWKGAWKGCFCQIGLEINVVGATGIRIAIPKGENKLISLSLIFHRLERRKVPWNLRIRKHYRRSYCRLVHLMRTKQRKRLRWWSRCRQKAMKCDKKAQKRIPHFQIRQGKGLTEEAIRPALFIS
jgi:hypothetical protein